MLSPSPLFDPRWYSEHYGLELQTSADALNHYIKKGVLLGYDPHPLFSVKTYRDATGCGRTKNPILHYLEHSQGRTSNFVSPSPYFSVDFYNRTNPDVAAAHADPFMHYLVWGWRENRMPNAYFSPRWYLGRYPDIVSAGVEPLSHFVVSGLTERRQPHHLIDINYYLAGNPDILSAGVDPFLHFMHHGDREGRSAHLLFDSSFYQSNGQSIGSSMAFMHYVETGARADRSPCPAFDPKYYSTIYPTEGVEPFLHFCLAEPGSRRHFHPLIDGDYQRATSVSARNGLCPLMDFVAHRSHFSSTDLERASVNIPKPRRALLGSAKTHRVSDPANEPKVSVIIPCYNSNLTYLGACVDSVLSQSYLNWELILADDGSPDKTTWPALVQFAERDNRIRAIKFDTNTGISQATNNAVSHAAGEYLAFVDHDDVITPNALSVMIERMVSEGSDAAYSDQAYLSSNNIVDSIFLKPDWSPTLFSGVMYVGHLLVVRKSVALDAGLFNTEFDGCQDFEFMLRVSEITSKILHIPEVLYHWRRAEGSVAFNSDAKGKIEPKQAAAVTSHFMRTGFKGRPYIEDRVSHRLRLRPEPDSAVSLVDVIVQGPITVQNLEMVSARLAKSKIAVASIRTVWKQEPPHILVAAGQAPWVLFLDQQISFCRKDWLDYMIMHAEQDGVAFVAPHQYRTDGVVVSAGLVILPSGELTGAHSGALDGQDGQAGSLLCDREVTAFGALCTLVSRKQLETLGGLSPLFLGLEGSIKEASFRATINGLRNIAVSSRLIEVADVPNRNVVVDALDSQSFKDLHRQDFGKPDPYYNPNYAQDRADFKIG